MKKEKKFGELYYENSLKPTDSVNVLDLTKELNKKTTQLIEEAIKDHQDYSDEYYIVIELQSFKIFPGTINQRCCVRKTPPIPRYDHNVWTYNNKTCELKYLYSIPDKLTCERLKDANLEDIPEEERQLAQFVKDFYKQNIHDEHFLRPLKTADSKNYGIIL